MRYGGANRKSSFASLTVLSWPELLMTTVFLLERKLAGQSVQIAFLISFLSDSTGERLSLGFRPTRER